MIALFEEELCGMSEQCFFFSREKFFVTREKNQFSTRESLILPVKKSQKQPVKQKSFP